MPPPSNKVTALTLSSVIAAGGVFTALDARYVSSADLDVLVQSIESDRVERLEQQISDAERTKRYLNSKPQDELTEWDRIELMQATSDKEAAIRKLERINVGMEQ